MGQNGVRKWRPFGRKVGNPPVTSPAFASKLMTGTGVPPSVPHATARGITIKGLRTGSMTPVPWGAGLCQVARGAAPSDVESLERVFTDERQRPTVGRPKRMDRILGAGQDARFRRAQVAKMYSVDPVRSGLCVRERASIRRDRRRTGCDLAARSRVNLEADNFRWRRQPTALEPQGEGCCSDCRYCRKGEHPSSHASSDGWQLARRGCGVVDF
jgi:hypothetical protein